MAKPDAKSVSFAVESKGDVSALLIAPKGARAIYVLAHGAGAGMAHPFMGSIAGLLAERGVATLRYQFPYMEAKSGRPDSPKVAEAAVRAAIAEAAKLTPSLPIFAGGKSFGGRMTSNAEAHGATGIKGIVFLGFPLHPAGAPDDKRGEHLADVKVPMLFLQGAKDDLASLDLLKPIVKSLGKRATLHIIEHGNHSFHVPAKSGRKDTDVMVELADATAAWVDKALAG